MQINFGGFDFTHLQSKAWIRRELYYGPFEYFTAWVPSSIWTATYRNQNWVGTQCTHTTSNARDTQRVINHYRWTVVRKKIQMIEREVKSKQNLHCNIPWIRNTNENVSKQFAWAVNIEYHTWHSPEGRGELEQNRPNDTIKIPTTKHKHSTANTGKT